MESKDARRRTLGKSRGLWRGVASVVCAWLLGCGTAQSSTDTRTNWLSSCAEDSFCGQGLSCVCGVCTTLCTADATCTPLGAQAACVTVEGCSEGSSVCARADFDVTVFSETDAGLEPHDSGTAPDANGTSDCEIPGRIYESRDPAACVTVLDCGVVAEGVGNVPFNDACGCGCEPYVAPVRTDTITERGCVGGPTGNAYPVAVVASSTLTVPTICAEVPNAIIRSAEELDAWVAASGCSDVAEAVSIVNYTVQTLVILGFSRRPSVDLYYGAQTIDGVIHFGILADAYCSGAMPPAGYIAIGLDATSDPVLIDVETCFDNVCQTDGGGPPP